MRVLESASLRENLVTPPHSLNAWDRNQHYWTQLRNGRKPMGLPADPTRCRDPTTSGTVPEESLHPVRRFLPSCLNKL
jgi:hypothetical protein